MCPHSHKFLISTSTAFCNCSGTLLPLCCVIFAPSLNSMFMVWFKIFPCLLKISGNFCFIFFRSGGQKLYLIYSTIYTMFTLTFCLRLCYPNSQLCQPILTSDFFASCAITIRASLKFFFPI